MQWLTHHSWYSDSLQCDGLRVLTPAGWDSLGPSSLLYNGWKVAFLGVTWLGYGVNHPPLFVPRLSMGRVISLPPLSDCFACYRTTFTFYKKHTVTNLHPRIDARTVSKFHSSRCWHHCCFIQTSSPGMWYLLCTNYKPTTLDYLTHKRYVYL